MTSRVLSRRMLAATLAGALALAACGGESEQTAIDAYEVVANATIDAGDAIPAPSGEPILAMSGKLAAASDGRIELDIETIERFGLVEYTLDDRTATGKTARFRGVLLGELLDTLGIQDDATELFVTALDDYSITIPMSDVDDYPMMLATSMDGERMAIDNYGPTRIMYPTHAYDLAPTTYDPRVIWQLEAIEVR